LLPPDSWVSIDEEVDHAGALWYRIDKEGYVLASDVTGGAPSFYHGLVVEEPTAYPIGFVVAEGLNVRGRPGIASDNPPVAGLWRYDTFQVQESVQEAGVTWHRIGEGQYVHGDYVRVVYPVTRPSDIAPEEKWIAVDLAQQVLSAYEGDRMVFATLVSTGRPPFYTPTGLTRIWIKLRAGRMQGGQVEKGDYYYLQDVPWIMYFNRDVGLHGAYWHDRFGSPTSHGCVNLSPRDAKWLYEWTTPMLPTPNTFYVYGAADNPGAWVYVYASSS
jgi:hypothetical protein